MDAFYEYFASYLYLNGMVDKNGIHFRNSMVTFIFIMQASETVAYWKKVAQQAGILLNIRVDQFIFEIRDFYMKVIDKDLVASQYGGLLDQLIDESEETPIV